MPSHFTGRVQRLYVTEDTAFIRLDIPVAQQPAENYFALHLEHANYNSLYSLALSAAINGNELAITTWGDIAAGEQGNVRYLVLDWRT